MSPIQCPQIFGHMTFGQSSTPVYYTIPSSIKSGFGAGTLSTDTGNVAFFPSAWLIILCLYCLERPSLAYCVLLALLFSLVEKVTGTLARSGSLSSVSLKSLPVKRLSSSQMSLSVAVIPQYRCTNISPQT